MLPNGVFFWGAQTDLGFGIRSERVPIGIMCAKIVENKIFRFFLTFLFGISRSDGKKWRKSGNIPVLRPRVGEKSIKKVIKNRNILFSMIFAHMSPIGTCTDRIPNPRSASASRKKTHRLVRSKFWWLKVTRRWNAQMMKNTLEKWKFSNFRILFW